MIFCNKRKSSLNICAIDCKRIKLSSNALNKRKRVYKLIYNEHENENIKAAKYRATDFQFLKNSFNLKFSTNFPLNYNQEFFYQPKTSLKDINNQHEEKVKKYLRTFGIQYVINNSKCFKL